MSRTKQVARKISRNYHIYKPIPQYNVLNRRISDYNVLNEPSSDLKRIWLDKKKKENFETSLLSLKNYPSNITHYEESKLFNLSNSELIDIILKKQSEMERAQLLFFKVFRNVYIKKKIFSYLPIFVSTIHSMICYGDARWCDPSDGKGLFIKDEDTYDCFIRLTYLEFGSAWTRYPISIEQDFIVSFQFIMNRRGADGIALVFLSSPHLFNTNKNLGHHLAYNGYSNGIFAVEFDTYENDSEFNYDGSNDIYGNHCSIQGLDKEGILSSHHDYSLGSVAPLFKLNDGLVHNVKLFFNHKNSFVSIELDSNIILSNIKIPNLLIPEPIKQSYIGLTSSVGCDHQDHIISNFRILKQ